MNQWGLDNRLYAITHIWKMDKASGQFKIALQPSCPCCDGAVVRQQTLLKQRSPFAMRLPDDIRHDETACQHILFHLIQRPQARWPSGSSKYLAQKPFF
ncbi:hypothetical protein DND58_28115 [Pseudomonas syringae pv. pisi]|nr:hypothetical protein DND58_28115 [Pseudomonas syringae pv. pisi]